jgi:hypothetical protein
MIEPGFVDRSGETIEPRIAQIARIDAKTAFEETAPAGLTTQGQCRWFR